MILGVWREGWFELYAALSALSGSSCSVIVGHVDLGILLSPELQHNPVLTQLFPQANFVSSLMANCDAIKPLTSRL